MGTRSVVAINDVLDQCANCGGHGKVTREETEHYREMVRKAAEHQGLLIGSVTEWFKGYLWGMISGGTVVFFMWELLK